MSDESVTAVTSTNGAPGTPGLPGTRNRRQEETFRKVLAAGVEMLREKLTISRYDSIIPGGRYHNFKDFIGFPNVGKANLVNKPLPRLRISG